jgi:GNAT superfamily N-acetyltransferase
VTAAAGERPPGAPLEARPARPSDRDGVLAFCASTFDWGDYVERVWDAWLNDPRGRCLVGLVEGAPVAVGRAYLAAPGEAWLEGIRVDPAKRGQGLATAFHQALVNAARALGAAEIRFFGAAEATLRIGQADGFHVVGAYTSCEAPAAPPGDVPWRRAGEAEASALVEHVCAPGWVTSVPGLISTDWRFHRATAEALAARARAGQLWLHGDGARPDLLALSASGGRSDTLPIECVYARPDALPPAPAALAALAGRVGLPRVLVCVPETDAARQSFAAHGYRDGAEGPGGGFWTYPAHIMERPPFDAPP